MDKKKSNSNVVKFNRWGYIFLIPFFVTYIIFSLKGIENEDKTRQTRTA